MFAEPISSNGCLFWLSADMSQYFQLFYIRSSVESRKRAGTLPFCISLCSSG
jgi:hypothetical protein